MPLYEIEQYEIHSMTYRIEADDPASAIVRLLDGEADPVDNSLEYIELADERGLWADDHPKLTARLHSQGLPIEHVIPSIRSVSLIDAVDTNTALEESA